jgi:hypothetical protein
MIVMSSNALVETLSCYALTKMLNFLVTPFYLQSVLVHSENCVKKHVYSDM